MNGLTQALVPRNTSFNFILEEQMHLGKYYSLAVAMFGAALLLTGSIQAQEYEHTCHD